MGQHQVNERTTSLNVTECKYDQQCVSFEDFVLDEILLSFRLAPYNAHQNKISLQKFNIKYTKKKYKINYE